MINFNFAATTENTQSISVRNKFGSFSARDFRTGIIVFMSVFLISFTALNFKDIFGGMKFDFWNKSGNENADNEKLTADLRALYGYTANGGEKNWLTGRMPSVAGAMKALFNPGRYGFPEKRQGAGQAGAGERERLFNSVGFEGTKYDTIDLFLFADSASPRYRTDFMLKSVKEYSDIYPPRTHPH